MKKQMIHRAGLVHPSTHNIYFKSVGGTSDYGKIEMSPLGRWLLLYDKEEKLVEKISARHLHALYYTDKD